MKLNFFNFWKRQKFKCANFLFGVAEMERKSSPDVALASDVFDQFCAASTLKTILTLHRHLCELLRLRPAPFPDFYPHLRAKLRSWRAQALWTKFDKRAAHKCYNRGLASAGTQQSKFSQQ